VLLFLAIALSLLPGITVGAAADDASSPAAVDLISHAYTISAGGTYQLPPASGGTITIVTK